MIHDSQALFVAGPFGDLLYSGSKSRAEWNAAWERRPQQFISRGTFHERPETLRAHPSLRASPRPSWGRFRLGEKYAWIWRVRLRRFLFQIGKPRKAGSGDRPRIRRKTTTFP